MSADGAGARRIHFVDFTGLGSAALAVPVLRAMETADPSVRYTYPANPLLSDPRIRQASGLRGLVELTEPVWRRFDRSDWAALAEHLETHRVSDVVNFRNPDLTEDGRYTDFRAWFERPSRPLRWHDLYGMADVASRHVQSRMTALLSGAGIEYGPLRPQWLAVARDWAAPGPPRRAGGPRIGLFCSASVPSKRWPHSYWRSLTTLLAQRSDAEFEVFCGTSGDERDAAQAFLESLPAVIGDPGRVRLVRPGTVGELAGRLAGLSVLVTNDTGVAHLAAACAVPTVSLFLSTDAKVWGPVSPSAVTLQSRTGVRCPAQRPAQGNCSRHYGDCDAPCQWDLRPADVARSTLAALGEVWPWGPARAKELM